MMLGPVRREPVATIEGSQGLRRDQILEFTVLVVLYLLQMVNAEMLRRAIRAHAAWQRNHSLLARLVALITDTVHPWAMLLIGLWLLLLAAAILLRRRLPRWSFDALGLWFAIRLVLEFLIINVLVFEPALVAPGVLLGQIVLYLPFFVLCWGWFLHRIDWVGRPSPGEMVHLLDTDPSRGVSRFDYFHSAINTLLNKGKPTIIGVSRTGRIAMLIFNGMLLCLYTVAFARILQLTRAVF